MQPSTGESAGLLMRSRLGNAHPSIAPYRDFASADGHVLLTCGGSGLVRALVAGAAQP